MLVAADAVGGWHLCSRHLPPSPSRWLGVFTGSQGVLWSQRGEGMCPLLTGALPSPGGPLRVAWCPWHPCACQSGDVPHALCHHAGIAGCRCEGTTRTGWISGFEGNPCPHCTLALTTSPVPRRCPDLAGRGISMLLRGCFHGPHLFAPCFRVTSACQDYQDPQA